MNPLSFLVLRGANAYIDDDSTHLALEHAKLPGMTETYEGFTPAGGNGAIEVALTREACEIGITTKGMQPEILRKFAGAFGRRRKVTIYGALVDEYADTRAPIQVIGTAYGRIGQADVGDLKSSELSGTEYLVKSISKYTLSIGNQEIARFNIQLGGWVDMEGQQVEIARMIGIV